MTTPVITSVSDNLLLEWIQSLLSGGRGDGPVSYLTIIKMTDAEKVTSVTAYLNARKTSNTTELGNLDQEKADKSTLLNADNTAINTALGTLS